MDTSKIKTGDVVHVRGRVTADSNWGFPYVAFDGAGPAICVKSTDIVDIVHIEPRPLQVGDSVRSTEGQIGVILALTDEKAWVKMTDRPWTYDRTKLVRA